MNPVLAKLFENYAELTHLNVDIMAAYEILVHCYDNGGKVLVCGNGGSAADCEHIAGELLKGFKSKRSIDKMDLMDKFLQAGAKDPEYFISNLQGALPAISLVSHSSLFTAWCNDVEPDLVFAQQVYGLGWRNDVLIAISTSGNAKNIVNAAITAKVKGMKTLALTGESGGELGRLCDVAIKVPSRETYRVQEYHLPIYHALCEMLEVNYFGV